MSLSVLYSRCAGLDVHKATVVACVLLTASTGKVSKQVRTFATTTAGLQELAAWLASQGVSHVAMESTGIYWRPVFNLLEGRCQVILVNAQHMKAVPGHKTDIKDSEWIADLLRHGLLKASFIPPKAIRDLRDLVRARKTLVRQRAQAITRIQKVLETANIKLSSVASDVLGVSGRDMLEAMLAGVSDAEALAALARGRLRKKLPALREALEGRVEATHRVLLHQLLTQIDFLQGQIDALSVDIDQRLSPYEPLIARLMQIPGVGRLAATAILAELGTDMSRFPSAKHLASWAGVAPGNKQSGGKRLKAHTNKGNTHLRAVLAEVVWVISHTRDNYLQTLDTTRQRDTAVRRLQALGYKVSLEEITEVRA